MSKSELEYFTATKPLSQKRYQQNRDSREKPFKGNATTNRGGAKGCLEGSGTLYTVATRRWEAIVPSQHTVATNEEVAAHTEGHIGLLFYLGVYHGFLVQQETKLCGLECSVALSTAEIEYIALSVAVCEAVWLLTDLFDHEMDPIITCDN
jgi:hypothetical protein